MIPHGRSPNLKEYAHVIQFITNRADLLTDWLKRQGTDITGEDILRCIINDWEKDIDPPTQI